VINSFNHLQKLIDDFYILIDFAKSDGDDASATEALETALIFFTDFVAMEQKSLLSDEQDNSNAILTINAGAGGTESCDWASMLFRMVTRWAEKKKYKCTVLDIQSGETAGIKSATLTIEGPWAFGLLKSESGIHRLVRISPFDSNARRHTSFSSIYVTPEVDDTIDIVVLDKDLRIDVYRAGGAGGQSVNTTDSAVRMTHLPTGFVVTCQNERSQLQNKARALKVLKSKLYERAVQERKAREMELASVKKEIGWGSQIRSYVLHPYKMTKDHRTKFVSNQPDKVLDGDLDGFMDAYLRGLAMGFANAGPDEDDDL